MYFVINLEKYEFLFVSNDIPGGILLYSFSFNLGNVMESFQQQVALPGANFISFIGCIHKHRNITLLCMSRSEILN